MNWKYEEVDKQAQAEYESEKRPIPVTCRDCDGQGWWMDEATCVHECENCQGDGEYLVFS